MDAETRCVRAITLDVTVWVILLATSFGGVAAAQAIFGPGVELEAGREFVAVLLAAPVATLLLFFRSNGGRGVVVAAVIAFVAAACADIWIDFRAEGADSFVGWFDHAIRTMRVWNKHQRGFGPLLGGAGYVDRLLQLAVCSALMAAGPSWVATRRARRS
jgi:hypothetical protein